MIDLQNRENAYWWREPKGKIHDMVFEVVKFIEDNQAYTSRNNLDYLRLYSNLDIIGLTSDIYTRVNRRDRLTLNIIQSMIDTLGAKIGKNRPRPMFLTDGGDFSKQLKAKKLQKFIDGIFAEQDVYNKGQDCFRDSGIFGTGVLKVYKQDGRIVSERILAEEIKIDDIEGVYGCPRQIHQTKMVSRDVLVEAWPEFKYEIMHAKKSFSRWGGIKNLADQIPVVESWHLPSGPNAKDGKHGIFIDNADLLLEEWNKDYFPFVFLRNLKRPIGFWGQGTAERQAGSQIEVNKILRTIQMSMHLGSIPKVFVENGSKVAIQQINNEIGGVIKYTGTKPSYEALSVVSPELFSQLDRIIQRAYENEGISMLSANSQKPAGLNSGKALREYNDIETERFSILGQAYEQFFMDAAKLYISIAKEIFTEEGKFEITMKGKKFIEKINWKEVDLDEDEYIMQMFPTSMLSKTPSGRLQDVQEMLQAGFIGKEAGIKLLDFPDLEGVTNLLTAAYDDVESSIDRMLDKGTYTSPEPYQNLQLLISLTQSAYLRARVNEVPEERLELLRRYMDEANAMLQGAVEPALPAEIGGASSPQGKPAQPPVTDMVPYSAGPASQMVGS